MAVKEIVPFIALRSLHLDPAFMEEYFAESLREEVHLVTVAPRASPRSASRSRVREALGRGRPTPMVGRPHPDAVQPRAPLQKPDEDPDAIRQEESLS